MIHAVLAALQLWVAPLLAGLFTLWSALVPPYVALAVGS